VLRRDVRLDAQDLEIARGTLEGSAAEGALMAELRAEGKLPETFRRTHGEQLLDRVLVEEQELERTAPEPPVAPQHTTALAVSRSLAQTFRTAEERPATEVREGFARALRAAKGAS
jgi:hypothetical protein